MRTIPAVAAAVLATAAALSGCTRTVTVTVTQTLKPVASHRPAVPTPSPSASVPVVFDCTGKAVTKPRTYALACADYGILLLRMRWSSWSANGAEGTGQLGVNNCTPNCASGKFGYTAAAVTLAGTVAHGGRAYFTHLKISDPSVTMRSMTHWTLGPHGPG